MSFKPYSRLHPQRIPYWESLMMLGYIQWRALYYPPCYPTPSLVPLDYLYLDTFAVALFVLQAAWKLLESGLAISNAIDGGIYLQAGKHKCTQFADIKEKELKQ